MQFTKDEFEQLCVVCCQYCSRGHTPEQRTTGEWVHSFVAPVDGRIGAHQHSQHLCGGDALRRSRFAAMAEIAAP